MNTTTKEVITEIAVRVPPGDRWRLVGDSPNVVYTSITETLEAYFIQTKTNCDYRLSPMQSKLYAIKEVVEEVVPEPPKSYNIYGDPV